MLDEEILNYSGKRTLRNFYEGWSEGRLEESFTIGRIRFPDIVLTSADVGMALVL